ncbi:MAG: hypothetical protein HS116_01510 [Planctomycetes bacterium]|nr:hypothetical protein [Planctomycetota bacterium]
MATAPQGNPGTPGRKPAAGSPPAGSSARGPAPKPASPAPSAKPPADPAAQPAEATGETRILPKRPSDGASPSGRARNTPGRSSGRQRSVSGNAVGEHRKALGLSEIKPSEMVKGLDKLAERAEKAHAREEAKRKAGGKMNLNVALHVDETGEKWRKKVVLGIVGLVVAACVIGGVMYWRSNVETLDPRAAAMETNNRLARYDAAARRMKPFEEDEPVSPELFKARLLEQIAADQAELEKLAEQEKQSREAVTPATVQALARLRSDLALVDGWGDPLLFKSGDDENEIEIRSKHIGEFKVPSTRTEGEFDQLKVDAQKIRIPRLSARGAPAGKTP